MFRFNSVRLLSAVVGLIVVITGCGLFQSIGVPDTEEPGNGSGNGEATNLLINGGFEELDDKGLPSPWYALGGGDAERYPFETGGVKVTGDVVKSGDVAIEMELDSGNYYVAQVLDVEPGKKYELSAWVKSTLSPGGKTAFKAEFRDIDKNYIPTAEGGAVSREWAESFEDWEKVSMSMVAPAAAADVVILIRLYGPGLAYYDDAILRVVE